MCVNMIERERVASELSLGYDSVECRERYLKKDLSRTGWNSRSGIFPAFTREGSFRIPQTLYHFRAGAVIWPEVCPANRFFPSSIFTLVARPRICLLSAALTLVLRIIDSPSATLGRHPRFQLVQLHLLTEKEREALRMGAT